MSLMSKHLGAQQTVRTCLVLGVQLDEAGFLHLLRTYHEDLASRFGDHDSFPAFSPGLVLNLLMPKYELKELANIAGGRAQALRDFVRRQWRLQLALNMSDLGALEQRSSPYALDRADYFLGREIASASMTQDHPNLNPYRSSRRLHIPLVRHHLEHILELMPDYLWWSLHEQQDAISNVLSPEKLHEVRRQIERAGFSASSFGLYLSTFETVSTIN